MIPDSQIALVRSILDSCEQRIKDMTGLDVRVEVRTCDAIPDDIAGFLIATCLQHWNVGLKEMKQKNRKRETVIMKSTCAFLLKVRTKLTLLQIGERVGYDDHSDVSNAIKRARNWIEVKDESFIAYYEPIKELFLNDLQTIQ